MAKRAKRPTRKEKIAASRAAEKAAISQAAASLDQPKPKPRPARDFIGMKKEPTNERA